MCLKSLKNYNTIVLKKKQLVIIQYSIEFLKQRSFGLLTYPGMGK